MKRKIVDVKITEGDTVINETITCDHDAPDDKIFKAARGKAMSRPGTGFLPMKYTKFQIVNETYFKE